MRFLLTLLIFSGLASPALACSCRQGAFSSEASRENILESPFIFDGEILKITPPPQELDKDREDNDIPPSKNPHFSKAEILIKRLYRGDTAQSITVYANTEGGCGKPLTEKQQGFFVIHVLKEEFVVAGQCDSYIAPHDMEFLKRGDFRSTDPEKPVVSRMKEIPFQSRFASFNDLKKWAETSTFGGGTIERAEFWNQKLAYVYRSYTSGIESSDIGVYQMSGSDWILVKSHEPVMNRRIKADIAPDALLFRATNNDEVLMTITPLELKK